MIEIEYSSRFVRKFKKLERGLQDEVVTRIEQFTDLHNHSVLEVHKLTGALKGLYAFSVNYSDRIIFEWSKNKKIAYLLDVGDHTIYE